MVQAMVEWWCKLWWSDGASCGESGGASCGVSSGANWLE